MFHSEYVSFNLTTVILKVIGCGRENLALLQRLDCVLACAAWQMCQMRVGREILKMRRVGFYFLSSVNEVDSHKVERKVDLNLFSRYLNQ